MYENFIVENNILKNLILIGYMFKVSIIVSN